MIFVAWYVQLCIRSYEYLLPVKCHTFFLTSFHVRFTFYVFHFDCFVVSSFDVYPLRTRIMSYSYSSIRNTLASYDRYRIPVLVPRSRVPWIGTWPHEGYRYTAVYASTDDASPPLGDSTVVVLQTAASSSTYHSWSLLEPSVGNTNARRGNFRKNKLLTNTYTTRVVYSYWYSYTV